MSMPTVLLYDEQDVIEGDWLAGLLCVGYNRAMLVLKSGQDEHSLAYFFMMRRVTKEAKRAHKTVTTAPTH